MGEKTTNQELLLAASLMARPELAPTLYPSVDLRALENPVARAAIDILCNGGTAYASPAAMRAALADLPLLFEEEDVFALCTLIPAPFDVELTDLITLRDTVERAAERRKLRGDLLTAAQMLRTGTAEDATALVDAALREYRSGQTGDDASTRSIVAQLRGGRATTRWRIGCAYLDEQNEGIGPDGKFGCGVSAQTEIIVASAQYGAGKSRWAYNIASSLIDQGAVIDWIVGEENRAVYSAKLLAARFDIPKSFLERYTASPAEYAAQYGAEAARSLEEMLVWYENINGQLYLHDGASRARIFKFSSALGLLEEQVSLHGSTHVIVDYAQIWKGEVSELEENAQTLREFATRKNISLIVLSQVPNDAMKFGPTPGTLPAKGTGDWGQIATFGFYIQKDPLVGQKEVRITQVKGRDSGEDLVYARFNVKTGRLLEYAGAPRYMDLGDTQREPARKGSTNGVKKRQ